MSARDFKILEQTGEGLKKVLAEKKRSFGEIKIEFPTASISWTSTGSLSPMRREPHYHPLCL